MSKSDFIASAEDELPPPYSATSFAAASPASSRGHDPASIPGLFSGQLDNLRSQILAEEYARQDAREQLDTQTLSILVPHVEDLLSYIATVSPTPSLVEMLLVPDDAIGPRWKFSEELERRWGEVRRVVRVKRDAKLASDEKRRPSPPAQSSLFSSDLSSETPREFTSWGRWDDNQAQASLSSQNNDSWFADEAMARRLAKHLQPAPKVDRTTVREQVAAQKKPEKKSRFGGLLRRDVPVPLLDRDRPAPPAEEEKEDLAMRVKAEEVSFRRENEMGIWESRTGWAIAVRVSIRAN